MTPSIISRAFGFTSSIRNRRQDLPSKADEAKTQDYTFYANGMEFAQYQPR